MTEEGIIIEKCRLISMALEDKYKDIYDLINDQIKSEKDINNKALFYFRVTSKLMSDFPEKFYELNLETKEDFYKNIGAISISDLQ